jgi:hypothetical protein
MPRVLNFYSISEALKELGDGVYHNNSACLSGRDIPENERRGGTGSYSLCDDCRSLNAQERSLP